MRKTMLTLVGAIGLAAFAGSAGAAPLPPAAAGQQASNIIEVSGGCGRAYFRNRWGHCVPKRHVRARSHPRWYGYHYPRPYRYYSYRSWSPSDNVANQLNAMELNQLYSGGGYYPRGYGWGY